MMLVYVRATATEILLFPRALRQGCNVMPRARMSLGRRNLLHGRMRLSWAASSAAATTLKGLRCEGFYRSVSPLPVPIIVLRFGASSESPVQVVRLVVPTGAVVQIEPSL